MNRIYELKETRYNVAPTIVVAKHPLAAVEQEYGPCTYVSGTCEGDGGPTTYQSTTLEVGQVIYIEVREIVDPLAEGMKFVSLDAVELPNEDDEDEDQDA